MSNADNTCKDCQKRYLGCHSECEEYARFRESRLERSRKIAEGRAKDGRIAILSGGAERRKRI